MSIPNTVRMNRRPTHPGEMLREDYLPDFGLTATTLAEAIGVSRQSINELLRERRSVSPSNGIAVGKTVRQLTGVFGSMHKGQLIYGIQQSLSKMTSRVSKHFSPA